MKQKYSSKNTSLNQVAAVYKRFRFPEGATVLDYGGGKYDTAAEYMKAQGVTVKVYDPYNRTPEENAAALAITPDYVVCSNVLNVIAEDEVIDGILADLASYPATVLITVYEGNGTGAGAATTKGYQRNQKAAAYWEMIDRHFSQVSKHNGVYICQR